MKTYVQSNLLRLMVVAVVAVLFAAGMFPDPLLAGAVGALPFMVGDTKNVDDIIQIFEEFKEKRFDPLEQALKHEKARNDVTEATIKRINVGGGGGGGEAVNLQREIELKALGKYIRKGDDASLAELKALSKGMSVDSDPDGGYLVLPQMSLELYATARDVSPLRRLARVETITTGDAWEQVINPDRADTAWAAEREARPQTENAKLKKVRIPLQENYANIPVTQKLIDDSGYNVGEFVMRETGLSFGEDEAIEFTVGNGVKTPRGFLTYPVDLATDKTRAWGSVQIVKTGVNGAFATPTTTVSPSDVLVDLLQSLKSAYRRRSVWLMNSLVAGTVRKMKDAQGRPIWVDSILPGQPSTLLGRPVEEEENMPDIAAGSLSIALADWDRAYVIVDRPGIKTVRDPFTSKPNVLFYSYIRVGAGLRDTRAIKLVQFSA